MLALIWSLANTSIGRIAIGSLAIVAGLWGVIWHAENKGITKGVEQQIAVQEEIDTSAKALADRARADVRRQIAEEATVAVAEEADKARAAVRDAATGEAAAVVPEEAAKARSAVRDAAGDARSAVRDAAADEAARTRLSPPPAKKIVKKKAKPTASDGFRRD